MKFAILFIAASLLAALHAATAAIPRRVPIPGWPNPPRPGPGTRRGKADGTRGQRET